VFEAIDLDNLENTEQVRQGLRLLLNLLEELKTDNQRLRAENQQLRDELHRLKGEQGQPDFKANKPKSQSSATDHSSEQNRRRRKRHQKQSKVDQIKIDRVEVVEVDPAILPADAEFKGYEEVTVQDLRVTTDNVLFRKEKYYSPRAGKIYLAELPPGYTGQFGPGVKALAIILYFMGHMTEPKILTFFENMGCQLSAGQLSNILIKNKASFHAEKEAVYEAGLHSSPWQHMDDTGMRVKGQNQHTHIICNPLYTVYVTTEKKDRLSVIAVLRNSPERVFRINQETVTFLEQLGLSGVKRRQVASLPQDQDFSETEFLNLLEQHLPDLGPQQHQWLLDAAAVTAYHAQLEFPVIKLLICDDAPQFKGVTALLALCWVHDGRHYKKLTPYVASHRQLLEEFLTQYWDFYNQLLAYRLSPTLQERARLSDEFDRLFSTETGYQALDDRIAKTKAKKEFLLRVLDHPEIPLHNNPAELAARQRVRKRKVSFGTRTQDGTQAWDTFMSLIATAKKLGLSFYLYIFDRISGTNQVPALADLIAQKADVLQLGSSWEPNLSQVTPIY
jgi:regulator of replication initiation timing